MKIQVRLHGGGSGQTSLTNEEKHTNSTRDIPDTEAAVIRRLRSDLRSVSDRLEWILDFGIPKRGRTAADREEFDEWARDTWERVFQARETLNQTDDWKGLL